MVARNSTPWWLDPGPQECEFCLLHYHYEAGYHCIECDRPLCPACVVEIRATRTVVCPECHAALAAEDGG